MLCCDFCDARDGKPTNVTNLGGGFERDITLNLLTESELALFDSDACEDCCREITEALKTRLAMAVEFEAVKEAVLASRAAALAARKEREEET